MLAREVRVHSPAPIDPGAVFDGLRMGFPSCYCYLVGTPELAFMGASPELLARRDGQRVQTVALAGTRRRSADPAVDSHLGEQLMQSPKDREEQAIVTRRIKRTLEPGERVGHGSGRAGAREGAERPAPGHADPRPAGRAAARRARWPAAAPDARRGRRAADKALPLIPALEGLDRGWYAGPVGWTDLAEDGEFCVALRCALLRGRVAHLYAGEGIVRDSVPAEELAANEAKLQALLPLLT